MDREKARKRAEDIVSKMTVKEKASQLLFSSPAIPRLGIPAYNWWNEALHGVARAGTATVFPQAIALGASFDMDLVWKIADAISTEGRAKYNIARKHGDRDIYKGLTFWSPNINIFRDPRWGRGQETYGEDPYLTSRLGIAFVNGLQGNGEYMKTAATAKHFAVHSGPEDLRHSFNAIASRKDMAETYLPAFKALVTEASVEAVMGAYNRVNGEACSASPHLQHILRGEWGFEGHFVSDCWALRDIHEFHHITKNAAESASLALKNGCDLNCGCTYNHLLAALNKGLVTEDDITRSAVRLFTARFLLGMFDRTEWDSLGLDDVDTPEHHELALQAAAESFVLLKNNGVLPLKNIKSIAVIGPNADNRTALAGNYHGTASRYITPLEGIEDEAEKRGIKVRYSLGCPLLSHHDEPLAKEDDRFSEALEAALSSDVSILVLGLDETLEGELPDDGNPGIGSDRKTLGLPGHQEKLLDLILSTGKPCVLVLESGSAADLLLASGKCSAILDIWYPGALGGKAVADVIFGNTSPSGKLPVTFYKSLDMLPDYTDYSMKGRTYRYADDASALYPFGFGLTYGRMELADVSIEECDDGFLIHASVHAASSVSEVLQVYVSDLDTPDAPKRSLKAFMRISLESGEQKTCEIKLGKDAFMTADDDGKMVIAGRHFLVSVGFSQPDSISTSLMGRSPFTAELDIPLRWTAKTSL